MTAEPAYETPKKDGSGMRAVTLADARKLGLLRSVTNYLNCLARPALESWKIEQAVLACLTSPRREGEALDEFVKRVLQVDQEQRQEAKAAAERGNQIHDALASAFLGEDYDQSLTPWIFPAFTEIRKLVPRTIAVETILVGLGYAGRVDLIGEDGACEWVIDWKSTRKLPDKGSWPEHLLQLSAYAASRQMQTAMQIQTANVYISTAEEGKFVCWINPPWLETFEHGFKPIVEHVCWRDAYDPQVYQESAREQL